MNDCLDYLVQMILNLCPRNFEKGNLDTLIYLHACIIRKQDIRNMPEQIRALVEVH